MKLKERLEEEANGLRAIRDEMDVQMHLGKLEAKDLWSDLEKRWEHVDAKLKQLGGEAGEAMEDVGAATQVMLEEIKRGYERLKALL